MVYELGRISEPYGSDDESEDSIVPRHLLRRVQNFIREVARATFNEREPRPFRGFTPIPYEQYSHAVMSAEDLDEGELVVVDEQYNIRGLLNEGIITSEEARDALITELENGVPIGVCIGGHVTEEGVELVDVSLNNLNQSPNGERVTGISDGPFPMGSYVVASPGSMCYGSPHGLYASSAQRYYQHPGSGNGLASRPQHRHRFSVEAVDKSWELVHEYMTDAQWRHFKGGKLVELMNTEQNHRILLKTRFFQESEENPVEFTILKGDIGEGMVEAEGKIVSRSYPIGDEVATFLAWFMDKTDELIEKWNCGSYTIVKDGVAKW